MEMTDISGGWETFSTGSIWRPKQEFEKCKEELKMIKEDLEEERKQKAPSQANVLHEVLEISLLPVHRGKETENRIRCIDITSRRSLTLTIARLFPI